MTALRIQFSQQEGQRAGEALCLSAPTPRTGLEMGLPCEMPVCLCGGGLKHALLCTTVSVCECVNVFECVSQCLVYGHNALLFYCALPPTFPASRQPLSQPCSPAHPSNSAILFFSTFTHLFIYDSHLLFTATLFSFFSLFMRFIEVFKCIDVVLLHHLVQ